MAGRGRRRTCFTVLSIGNRGSNLCTSGRMPTYTVGDGQDNKLSEPTAHYGIIGSFLAFPTLGNRHRSIAVTTTAIEWRSPRRVLVLSQYCALLLLRLT